MTGPLTFSDGTQLPPTGQPIQQDWAALVRFEGDRIAEFHEFYDQLTLMVQLGRHGLTKANERRLACLSLFWHFLDVIWIGVFTFVYLLGMLR